MKLVREYTTGGVISPVCKRKRLICLLLGHDFLPRDRSRSMVVHEMDTGLVYEEYILKCKCCGYETT